MSQIHMRASPKTKERIKVNFCVSADLLWPDIRNSYQADMEELARDSRGTIGSWLIRTYVELKNLGCTVAISDRLDQDSINVSDAFSFGRRQRLNDYFIVVARSDGPFPALANFVIHQNEIIKQNNRSANIPHWPQPGLIARDTSRGSSISRLSFKGQPWNLDARFRDAKFVNSLNAMGIELDFPKDGGDDMALQWRDYSKSDAVIAVRNLTEQDASIKPASKLINAWIAGVPALLGPEPAFRELRRSPLDYIEVTEAETVLEELRKWRENPDYYADIIANGHRRAEDFTSDKIALQWQNLFDGPILDEFNRWRIMNPVLRWLRVLEMHFQVGSHRRAHYYGIDHGKRILDQ